MLGNTTHEQLEKLKCILLALKATGAIGFEGFMRVCLTELTGIPFRLATSGLQGGMDGAAALRSDAVSFEAKRYSGGVQRSDVLTKIVDLARNNDAPDRLWVLGATTEIGTQLATAVQETGDQHGISTLILDWVADPFPLLAITAVASGSSAIDFLSTNCDPKPNREKLVQLFGSLSKHPSFDNLLQNLRSSLNVSSLAMARSIKLNGEWLAATFGTEHTARVRLGQALAINANSKLPPLRTAQREQIKKNLEANANIVLHGEEGHGKSWLAAQICHDHAGLAIFVSAEQFENIAPNSIDECLIDLLIAQTGGISDETVRLRWRHRIAVWSNQSPVSSILVVVDGINQRQSLRWDRILNSLQARLQAINGRMVVTVRPQFWHKIVAPGLTFTAELISVPAWTPQERDQLLAHYGINFNWLDDATLRTLCNPRLLGVAVATLLHQDSTAWKGLTVDRLLMEHLRASQRENFEDERLSDLTNRLSTHAKAVLERVQLSSNEPPLSFEADSTSVIETRFFRTLHGPGDVYELRDEGLTLALGYTLIDQLWQAQQRSRDLDERITQLIDPIRAMDRTTDVMFAALMVCALDTSRFDQTIFVALLDAFSNLQNIDDRRFEEFVEIVKHQPTELFNTLGTFTLERGQRLNYAWLVQAAFAIAATDEGWPVAAAAIHQWLGYYNKDAADQTIHYSGQGNDEVAKRLLATNKEIQDVLTTLSPFESTLMAQMKEVKGEIDGLFTLALKLLAGRPLAEFSNSFVALGLGLTLDRRAWQTRKFFQQLTTFNRVDREAAKEAFQTAIEPLRSTDPSRAGQWTVVRMLYACGDEVAAVEASQIAEKLNVNWPSWNSPSPGEWRQCRVGDSNAIRPINMDKGLESFLAINPDNLLQSMVYSIEDHRLQEFLPVACRFEAQIAIEKIRGILAGLLTRTSLPLRQLIFNGTEYAPLLTRDLALQLVDRAKDGNTDMFVTMQERDQNILRMIIFGYAAPHLTPAEQLDCMRSSAFGSDYLLDVIPSLKPQSAEAIINALQLALGESDEDAAYVVLASARYGDTLITSDLEPLIQLYSCSESSKLRSLSFQIAIDQDLKTVRDAHVKSGWSCDGSSTRSYENWFGSILLAEAFAKEELAIHELFDRISPRAWFTVAERVGDTLLISLADRFLLRLQGEIRASRDITIPALSLTLSMRKPSPYPLFSVDEAEHDTGHFPRQQTFREMFAQEGDEFEEKQERLHASFDAFLDKVQKSDVQLLCEHLTIDDMKRLVSIDSMMLSKVVTVLEAASKAEFRWLKNIAFIVANLLSEAMPDKAIALFQRALATQGVITCALDDDLTLEHEAIWSSAPAGKIQDLWRQRILSAESDEVLAREVVAAERFGAASFINSFVRECAESQSTLDQAYAITVAGFATQSGLLIGIVKKHLGDKGITGAAARKAQIAHETAEWAKKWLQELCNASSPEVFWNCLMILKTCMDARTPVDPISSTKWQCYAPTLWRLRKKAIKEKNKARAKTLVGQEVPEVIFISRF